MLSEALDTIEKLETITEEKLEILEKAQEKSHKSLFLRELPRN